MAMGLWSLRPSTPRDSMGRRKTLAVTLLSHGVWLRQRHDVVGKSGTDVGAPGGAKPHMPQEKG